MKNELALPALELLKVKEGIYRKTDTSIYRLPTFVTYETFGKPSYPRESGIAKPLPSLPPLLNHENIFP